MFKDKNVVVLGLARSGVAASKFLAKEGANVTVTDMVKTYDENILAELKSLGVNVILGSNPDNLVNESTHFLIKNPGVPIDHKYVLEAKKLGIPAINEVEMSYYYLKNKNIKIVAITGSNGKTTTTTLTYKFLLEDKKPVVLAGNIGYPLCEKINDIKDGDILVIEVSCQQLENLETFNPDIAIMTNITEAHIDFMKTYDHYKYVKSKLIKNQTANDIAIINKENNELLSITTEAKSIKKYFSSKEEIEGAYLKDNAIYYFDEKIIDTKDILLRGIHNYENIMGAIMAVKELGCTNESIINVLKTFNGVEHRLEYVCTKNGRMFYNDTEATNIKCAQIALDSFTEPTIILLGGLERGQNFDDLKDHIKNVKAIIAMGQCKQRVKDFGDKNNIPTYVCDYIIDATKKAYEVSSEGDVILLSPGSASWDQYKECEERGTKFKEVANTF